MSKYGFNYRVEVEFFTRSHDGDDWITGSHWFNFDKLDEAIAKAKQPFNNSKDLIESSVYDMTDSRDLIWKKDWIEDSITDYTTLPGMEYYNREYDNGKE